MYGRLDAVRSALTFHTKYFQVVPALSHNALFGTIRAVIPSNFGKQSVC